MAIVEEISLEEAMQHHSSLARMEETKPPPEDTRWNLHIATTEDIFPPCIVEEEDPPDDNTGETTPIGLPTREERDSSTRASGDSGKTRLHLALDAQLSWFPSQAGQLATSMVTVYSLLII
jgi:hypothetical protein